jgi:hypothetical protein
MADTMADCNVITEKENEHEEYYKLLRCNCNAKFHKKNHLSFIFNYIIK